MKICRPVAGAAIAFRCARVIRGIKKPKVVEFKSKIEVAFAEAAPTTIFPEPVTANPAAPEIASEPVIVSPALSTGL